ncbi:MAG TPA: hypothetical protein DD405_00290 [Desulfobacteraceae bacterium]|nr:hypothetical protein [Desulfobacteraceae bacterium]
MSSTVNNNDSASKKNTDEAMLFQAIHESMLSIKHKFLFVSSQGEVRKKIFKGKTVKDIIQNMKKEGYV